MGIAPAGDVDVIVVGAGIAGLTAAIALDRVGIRVLVVERATALTQAGTALSLWPNAQAALHGIGLSEAVGRIGIEEPSGSVRTPAGKGIMVLDQSRLHRDLGTPTLIVRRGDLQQMLLDAASHLPIRMRSPAVLVETAGDVGVVALADGERLTAPVVLGCDGLGGVSRSVVDNPPLTYRGRTSWRAVLEHSPGLAPEACLTVGEGKQFIVGPLRGGATYWAADVGLPEGANAVLADRKEFLLGSFSGWHRPIAELIGRTDEDRLVIADFYDSIPRALTAGRVALLGDAVHPMTPDLGQGACQGIEDGVVVAACLARHPDPRAALAAYQAARLRRVRLMVAASRRIGRLATSRSEIVSGVRNLAVRAMPGWLNARAVARYASEASFLDTLPPAARLGPEEPGAAPV